MKKTQKNTKDYFRIKQKKKKIFNYFNIFIFYIFLN